MPGLGLMKSGCLHIQTHMLLVWHSNSFIQCMSSGLQLLGNSVPQAQLCGDDLFGPDISYLLCDTYMYICTITFVYVTFFFWYAPFVVGLYYHLPKRAAGIRYVFIGKPMNQRPR